MRLPAYCGNPERPYDRNQRGRMGLCFAAPESCSKDQKGLFFLISNGALSAKGVRTPSGMTRLLPWACLLWVIEEAFLLSWLVWELRRYRKWCFRIFDSLLCAPTVRIFKIRTCMHSRGMPGGRGFVCDQGEFLQAGCRPAKKFDVERGQKARLDGAWRL